MGNEIIIYGGEFKKELSELLLKHKAETLSDPDAVLREYIIRCVASYDAAIKEESEEDKQRWWTRISRNMQNRLK